MSLALGGVMFFAYLIGAFPTSIVACRWLGGVDIRKVGSGNAGATNVYRVLGFKIALLVLVIDALKGVAGVFIPLQFVPGAGLGTQILGGLMAIIGHVWTVFAEFKGGKGVGTSLGVFLALIPIPASLALMVWIGIAAKTRLVSLASLSAAAVLAVSAAGLLWRNKLSGGAPMAWFAFSVAVFVFFTHRANIGRLLKGVENKIQFSSKER